MDDAMEILTTAQAASLIEVTQAAINDAIKRGVLPAQKISKRLTLVRRGDVLAYRAAHDRKGGWPKGRPRKQPEEQSVPPEQTCVWDNVDLIDEDS